MASPLPSASSPPSTNTTLPSQHKRKLSTSGLSNKKPKIGSPNSPQPQPVSRKNSFVQSKLRQTSFPPDEAAAAAIAQNRSRRSPSVASNATNSFTRSNSVDRLLVPSGSGGGAGGGGEGEDGEEDEDDEKDDYGTAMLSMAGTKEKEDRAKEDKLRLS